MVMKKTTLLFALLGLSSTAWLLTPALADHDRSGIGIPAGHLPPPGKCRVWFPDRPPGHQPPPGPCETLRYNVPLGAKLVYGGPRSGGEEWLAEPVLADPPPWAPAHGYRSQFADIGGGTCDRGLMSSEFLGGAVGGALGGFLGPKVGKGSGQLAATAAGVLLGALVGSSIGRSMGAADQHCVGKTLEAAPDNQTIAWRNPDANAAYTVTPVKTFQDRSGRYCREYTTEAVIGGRTEQVYGTACRQPDGSWQLVS